MLLPLLQFWAAKASCQTNGSVQDGHLSNSSLLEPMLQKRLETPPIVDEPIPHSFATKTMMAKRTTRNASAQMLGSTHMGVLLCHCYCYLGATCHLLRLTPCCLPDSPLHLVTCHNLVCLSPAPCCTRVCFLIVSPSLHILPSKSRLVTVPYHRGSSQNAKQTTNQSNECIR